ncbi:MAG: carbamoyltransferase [Candidatus Diapherotrites archaeon]|nr:carbamoyltransferase [Candidatus Diapherotrites archaeon]
MDILGISCYYHDSAACLLRDGKIIAAAHEERFSRKKHDLDFPEHAIAYCLKAGKTSMGKIDYVAFYEKPFLKFERLLFQFIQTWPFSIKAFMKSMPPWLTERLVVPSKINDLGFKGEILFMEHHLSHAASCFLCSPFKEAAILTIDGVGEWATTTLGTGKGNSIKILKEINFPHSIGLLYSTVTAYLGFTVNNSEYKVMGLSAFGKPRYYDKFKQIIDIKEDGSYQLDMDYFEYHKKMSMPSKKFVELFGPAREKESKNMDQRYKDIAASLQKITEEAVYKMANHLQSTTGQKNLCMAGGVALNSLANGKILKNTKFKKIWIQPSAGDAGASMGAALYAYHAKAKKPERQKFEHCFLGPEYSDREIEAYLNQNKIKYSKFKSRGDLLKKTAKMIFDNEIVAWFQGNMEWGPRALGNRSILSNACNPNMKDVLNQKVKHREHFRPFAPVITEKDTNRFFECDLPLPEPAYYMLMVYPIKKQKQKIIPAVTHVDGTGRLQVINRKQNPLYYDLIKEFEKHSRVPILINTSFNIRGEPIVCTPHDAYKCVMGTGIDCLVMGSYLVRRRDNPKDIWDSEKIAID